jgi:hypothetical protein
MLHHSFTKLCELLKPALEVDAIMSSRRTNKEVITPEIILASYLRWVGGGSYLDIRTAAGISVASFYRVIKKCTAALLSCQQLQYNFPTTYEELTSAANGFASVSTHSAINGCVACIDG